ncbi:MAG: c-type cytochrome [Saprospiraceae bacterium]|nr:c-type cytochrome [Saprospiraceae bacterium]
MKKRFLLYLLPLGLLTACGGGDETADNSDNSPAAQSMIEDDAPADPKGIGEIKHVELNSPLDADLIAKGSAIYDLKCSACHKLTGMRVVGPGWKGVTDRRTPEWIMNMTLNVDVMLDEDPAAQALLKECLVRMPNQNLTEEDARSILEFMLKNDGKS